MNKNIEKWLLNPFEYIAVQKALGIGVIAMLLSGIVNIFTNAHFSGVIDFVIKNHENYTFELYIYESFINWFVFSLLLYLAGLIFSRSSIRFIDVLSMQALARTPFLLISLFTFLLPQNKINEYFKSQILKGETDIIVPLYQWVLFVLYILLIAIIAVWIIILMYKAYSLACNLKGVKGVISFIVALLVAEGILEYLFYTINNYFLIK